MKNSKQLTEAAILTAIFMVLLLITAFVPLLGSITFFFIPIPFVIYANRHGWKPSLLMSVLALFLSTLFVTFLSIPLTIMAALSGVLIGEAIRNNLSAYETWLRATVGFVVGLVFILVFAQWFLQVNFVDEFTLLFNESIQTTENVMRQFGQEITTEDIEAFHQLKNYMIDILPTTIVTISIFLAFICQWVSYKVINRIERNNLHFPKFRDFVLPKVLIWIYLLAMLAGLFLQDSTGSWYIVVVNVMNLVGILIALQGISFILFYAHIKGISKSIPIFVIIFLILIPSIGMYLLRILGIIDLGFQLRDRWKK